MYTFDSRVRYSETNQEGKLTMASLINYFQDCSTFQSEELGVGVDYLKENHQVWVLAAWQIVVERYPRFCENVTIGTLPYGLKGFLGYRNFFMKDDKGNFLAKANSLWSLLDTDTGKPCAISELQTKKYALDEKLEMEYAPKKIGIPQEMKKMDEVVVKQHHLDTNQHVNNQQFVEITMEYLPKGYQIKQLRVEYKMQAYLGDVMIPFVARSEETIVVVLKNVEDKPYVVVEFQGRDVQ